VIYGILYAALTPIGMLVLVLGIPYLQMARGKLVPRSTLEDAIHDRDEWRAAHRISETARQVHSDQVAELLEHARTTDAFIRSLPHPGGRDLP
jgi:hypothetical protein